MASGASTNVMRTGFIVGPLTVHILFLSAKKVGMCDVSRCLLGDGMTKVFSGWFWGFYVDEFCCQLGAFLFV